MSPSSYVWERRPCWDHGSLVCMQDYNITVSRSFPHFTIDGHCLQLCMSLMNCVTSGIIITSLPKVIWEQGRVAAAVPGAGWHKGLRIRNVCIVFVKDTCVRKRAVF